MRALPELAHASLNDTHVNKTVQESYYFLNFWWDVLFIGGTSILTFFIISALNYTHPTPQAIRLASWLTWIANSPHFFASSHRLYQTRDRITQFPLTSFLVPVFLSLVLTGALVSPLWIAPYLVKIYLLWSPYHYSGQSYGISLLYARRAKVYLNSWARWFLALFIFGTFLSSNADSEVSTRGNSYYGIHYPGFGISPVLPVLLKWATLFSALGFFLFCLKWWVNHKKRFPVIILVPAISQFIWFQLGSKSSAFNLFVPFFHSVQYLFIVYFMSLKDEDGKHPDFNRSFKVSKFTLKWVCTQFIGGVFLFHLLPYSFTLFGLSSDFVQGTVLVVVQIHHFFVDAVIWKIKKRPTGVDFVHELCP